VAKYFRRKGLDLQWVGGDSTFCVRRKPVSELELATNECQPARIGRASRLANPHQHNPMSRG